MNRRLFLLLLLAGVAVLTFSFSLFMQTSAKTRYLRYADLFEAQSRHPLAFGGVAEELRPIYSQPLPSFWILDVYNVDDKHVGMTIMPTSHSDPWVLRILHSFSVWRQDRIPSWSRLTTEVGRLFPADSECQPLPTVLATVECFFQEANVNTSGKIYAVEYVTANHWTVWCERPQESGPHSSRFSETFNVSISISTNGQGHTTGGGKVEPFVFSFPPVKPRRVGIPNGGKPNYVTVVTMNRNGAKILPEWIEYHLAVGVDHVVVVDHNSTDNTLERIHSYVDERKVTYVKASLPFPADSWQWAFEKIGMLQSPVYSAILNRYRLTTEWMLFIDADEFLVHAVMSNPQSQPLNIHEWLEENVGESYNEVHIKRKPFGGKLSDPDTNDLIIERFKYSADESEQGKSMIRTRSYSDMFVHDAPRCDRYGNTPRKRYYVSDYYPLRLNHYYCSPVLEAGRECQGTTWDGSSRNQPQFQVVHDHTMDRYIHPVGLDWSCQVVLDDRRSYRRLYHFSRRCVIQNSQFQDRRWEA